MWNVTACLGAITSEEENTEKKEAYRPMTVYKELQTRKKLFGNSSENVLSYPGKGLLYSTSLGDIGGQLLFKSVNKINL